MMKNRGSRQIGYETTASETQERRNFLYCGRVVDRDFVRDGCLWWRTQCLMVAMVALVAVGSANALPMAKFNLVLQEPVDHKAKIDVGVNLADDANIPGIELFVAFELGVEGSSSLLTNNATDYSRFSFMPDNTTLAGWVQSVTFGPFDTDSTTVMDSFPNGTPLQPGDHHLGVLEIDLTGLPSNGPVSVTIAELNGQFPTNVTYDDGQLFDFAEITFNNGSVNFDTVTIPEPVTAVLGLMSLGVLVARYHGGRSRIRKP